MISRRAYISVANIVPQNVRKAVVSNNYSALRSTQAAEVFRSNYAKMAGSDVTIQTTALDHLVGETQTRPSVLIDVYGVVGGVLGMITRGAPRELKNAVSGSVDEAVRRSLNDDIRDMDKNEEEEVKETLKFHRDITLHEEGGGETDTSTYLGRAKEATTLALHNALRLSRKI